MSKTSSGQKQLAVRVDDEMLKAIDQKRMELANSYSDGIPTRSEIVRLAIDAYIKGIK